MREWASKDRGAANACAALGTATASREQGTKAELRLGHASPAVLRCPVECIARARLTG